MWLKGMGGGLYKTLVPPELKEALWENRDKIKYLNILSAVEPMPWEFSTFRIPLVPSMEDLSPIPRL